MQKNVLFCLLGDRKKTVYGTTIRKMSLDNFTGFSEACQKMTLDNQVTGSFSDVRKLYDAEKENLLKTSPLTNAAAQSFNCRMSNTC